MKQRLNTEHCQMFVYLYVIPHWSQQRPLSSLPAGEARARSKDQLGAHPYNADCRLRLL